FVKRRRFATLVVEREGAEWARQLRGWAGDHRAEVAGAVSRSSRPEWLSDRACDNWATLFAVEEMVGGAWPERALAAARTLTEAVEEGDHTELLLHDMWRLWRTSGWGEAVQSGELCDALNRLET